MSARRTLTETEIRDQPWSVWNAFVDLLAMSELDDLDARQRPAHLVFWYESEVQNGGHFQYFENRGLAEVPHTIAALEQLGAHCQAQVLSQASQVASERQWGEISTVEEFVSETLVSGLSEFDVAYHECTPSIHAVLERHLEEHRHWYVEVGAA